MSDTAESVEQQAAEAATGCWINGQPGTQISATDRGLQFGDGLFETLPVIDGKIALLESHLQRLHDGCKRLKLPCAAPHKVAEELARAAQGQKRALLKLIVTRGTSGHAYHAPPQPQGLRVLLRYAWPQYPAQWAERGVHVHLCDTHLGHNSRLAGLKHLNRLEQVLAQSEWGAADNIQEGLMTDTDGSVIGGTASNVFAWLSHGVLATPSLRLCGVAGVMREYLLQGAEQTGMQLRVATLSLSELMRAPEIFLCSSLFGVWPVTYVGHWKYAIGDVTRRMQRWAGEIMTVDTSSAVTMPFQKGQTPDGS